MTVRELSSALYDECGKCLDRFYEMREKDAVPDFYEDVKPYADYWHGKINEWQKESLLYIQQERPKYVHKSTIDTAAEGMTQFFVQSFYKETSKKRFIQTIQAAQYTLQTFILAIDEKSAQDD
ncbi:YppE family protein [Planococcus donghaensis]|uniref:YppE family protein n=1 Tax=Planococcus donghaensis TaxID=414778 RepID=UPI0037361EF8